VFLIDGQAKALDPSTFSVRVGQAPDIRWHLMQQFEHNRSLIRSGFFGEICYFSALLVVCPQAFAAVANHPPTLRHDRTHAPQQVSSMYSYTWGTGRE
jgi:hypothetical protein